MRTLLILSLAIFHSLFGAIQEISHFSEVPLHLTEDTLLVLDIDDTLLIPTQMLGCDEWFNHRLNLHRAKGLKSADALEKSLAEWEAVRHLTKMAPVEEGAFEIIRSLQKQGYTTMGLTTQGLALATRTYLQLKENGFDLTLTAPDQEDHYFLNGLHGVLFRKGILFTSGTAKGEALFKLCSQIGFIPKRIVFVNDKATHLQDIESSAIKRGIEFLGLRYGYSDFRKKAFDPSLSDYQFTHSTFDHLLSDEEAKAGIGS